MPAKLLLNLDVGPLGALLRIVLGGAFVLALRLVHPDTRILVAAAALGILLFGVKAFAAVARRIVPASRAVRAHQEWRRNLARFHDSYQWRKLLWFGIGIVSAAQFMGPEDGWEMPLGTACVLCGAVAQLVWRRKGLPLSPPLRV
jgi:hypothetical protein